jgi:hypothetical protein
VVVVELTRAHMKFFRFDEHLLYTAEVLRSDLHVLRGSYCAVTYANRLGI